MGKIVKSTKRFARRLNEREQKLIAPDLQAVAQAGEMYRRARAQLDRSLMLLCPAYGEEEGLTFDANEMAIFGPEASVD